MGLLLNIFAARGLPDCSNGGISAPPEVTLLCVNVIGGLFDALVVEMLGRKRSLLVVSHTEDDPK